MSLSARVLAAQTDAAEYARYEGFTFVTKAVPGRRTVPRCSWTDMCGYRTGANLIDIMIAFANGQTPPAKEAQKVRETSYQLLQACHGPVQGPAS